MMPVLTYLLTMCPLEDGPFGCGKQGLLRPPAAAVATVKRNFNNQEKSVAYTCMMQKVVMLTCAIQLKQECTRSNQF
jgi:hypothetical protein